MQKTVRHFYRYICDNVQRYGAKATVHDLACRMVDKMFHFQIWKGMTVRLQDVRDPTLFHAPGFEARFVGERELDRFARDRANDLSLEFLRKARARGDRCYALFDGDRLASYGWYSNLTAFDEHFELHFDRAYTYLYKGYTVPAYRGQRLYAVGICRALRAFTAEGKKGLISYALSNNFASLRATERVGCRIFGEVYVLRVGGRSFTYATKGCRDYGFVLKPASSRCDERLTRVWFANRTAGPRMQPPGDLAFRPPIDPTSNEIHLPPA